MQVLIQDKDGNKRIIDLGKQKLVMSEDGSSCYTKFERPIPGGSRILDFGYSLDKEHNNVSSLL